MRDRLAEFVAEAGDWAFGRSPWLRAALLAYLAYAGVSHLTLKLYRSWFAGITLAFHEMGHLLFIPLGNTLMILGGTILQLAVPLIAAIYLYVRQRDYFGLAVGASWLATSLWEAADYIYDAPRLNLALVGFGDDPQHDWGTLLTRWHVLNWSDQFAFAVRCCAFVTWAAAITFGGWLCWIMWDTRRSDRPKAGGAS